MGSCKSCVPHALDMNEVPPIDAKTVDPDGEHEEESTEQE